MEVDSTDALLLSTNTHRCLLTVNMENYSMFISLEVEDKFIIIIKP